MNAIARLKKPLALLALLYVFLVCISLMGSAFKLLGSDFTETLITSTSNPIVGLMVGMLATAIIQSSSTTTSIIVGLVAAGALTVGGAIPMVMGANIGTTVTNTIVAMTSMNRRAEFRRSFAGATMHDFFNALAVLVILPLELATHVLERTASWLATLVAGQGEVEFVNPIKSATKPVAGAIMSWVSGASDNEVLVGVLALLVSIGGIFIALAWLPRLLKTIFLARAESAMFRYLTSGGVAGIAIGVVITVLVQSSSITTSLLVPMIGSGILSLEGAFAVTLGANIGTTVTALLASTAGTHDAVAIAFVHLLFNILGILIIYPIKAIRRIPIGMARWLAIRAMKWKLAPVLYLVLLFFALPGVIILLQRIFGWH